MSFKSWAHNPGNIGAAGRSGASSLQRLRRALPTVVMPALQSIGSTPETYISTHSIRIHTDSIDDDNPLPWRTEKTKQRKHSDSNPLLTILLIWITMMVR